MLVAWDGSSKLARGLNYTLPFLREASHVELVSVTGQKDLEHTVPGAEIAPHLTCHDIEVNVLSLPALHGDVAEILRRYAKLTQVDRIVMGPMYTYA